MVIIHFLLLFVFISIINSDYCDKEEGCERKDTPNILTRGSSLDISDANNMLPLDDPVYLIPEKKYPQILWWDNLLYTYSSNTKFIECPLGKCTITKDREELNNPLTRGLFFYGSYFGAKNLPLPRLPHHEWVLFHEESPKNQWLFSTELGISLFNHTATFRRESDYPISTQFIRDPNEWFDDEYFVTTEEKNRLQKEEGLASVVYVQRNCNAPSGRDSYIQELMKYINVDSYGKCLNNKEMPEEIDGFHKLSSKPYYHFLSKYKFQLAFENAVCQDYMTEKLFRPLQIGSVPVYSGSPGVLDFMPSDKAVIVATDFKSPKDLADYLKELNEDDNKYNEYLKHRVDKKITNPTFSKILENQKWKLPHIAYKINFKVIMLEGLGCHICDQLHERNNMLREHLKDPSKPIKPVKIANSSHMGCPKPKPMLHNNGLQSGSKKSTPYHYLETDAILKMLVVNETDTLKWKNYMP